MPPKTTFLQIRVSASEKAAIRRLARAAGMDLSAYVLTRAIPSTRTEFEKIILRLQRQGGRADSHELAALNDLLSNLTAAAFTTAVADLDTRSLSAFLANYIAAMVEQAAGNLKVDPPQWTTRVPPLDAPWFAATLTSLRTHLLRSSPVAFKRRNMFIDATLGARV
jgi:uncharacterized protein (DUF1778 family)